ncbi:MAG: hypothetical protein ACNI25_10700 [Halarcobacter sp.]
MIKKLFDREHERHLLKTFFESNDSFFIVIGESGVGKSSIIQNTLIKNFSLSEIISISFKPENNINNFIEDEDFLKNRIHSLYSECRKRNINIVKNITIDFKDKLSTISTSVGISGPVIGLGFSNKNITVDEDYIIQFDKIIYGKPYKIIYFSNIELANANDLKIVELFFKLVRNKKLNIKMIFEVGTLSENTNSTFLKKLLEEHDVLVKPFNEYFTNDFYKFYHKANPPIELFAKSKGNPFYIVHYSKSIKNFAIFDLIKSKLASLDIDLLNIVYTLYILGGSASIKDFKELSEIKIDTLLFQIEQLELLEILTIYKNKVSFFHSFFSIFLDTKDSVVLTEISIRIKNRLLNDLENIQDDNILLLINLLYKTNEIKKLRKVGWDLAKKTYLEQKYNLTIFICKILIENISEKKLKTFPSLLLIQSSILIGNAQNYLKYLKKFVSIDINNKYLVSCIKSQLLYQENKFQESVNEIERTLKEINNQRLEIILLGLNCSNYIALGNFKEAKSNFIQAKSLAEILNYKEILFELLRLSPKIFGWKVGSELIYKFTNNKISNSYEYTKYKSKHNLGFAKILTTEGKEGLDELLESKSYFEINSMPEVTYSVVGLSVYLILKESLDDAMFYLLDAKKFYTKAFNILNNRDKPLSDPILVYKSNYNLSLIYLILGDYPNAKKFYNNISIPTSASFYEARIKKNEWLYKTIKEKR